MSDATTTPPAPPPAAPATEPTPAPSSVTEASVGATPAPGPFPTEVPRRSRAWIGIVALFVAVALLAGATVALFIRVQETRDRADEAVVLAGGQDELADRIDRLDATLASIEAQGTATADDVTAAREQVIALRKCVNGAIDAWAQATQSGKAVSITKC